MASPVNVSLRNTEVVNDPSYLRSILISMKLRIPSFSMSDVNSILGCAISAVRAPHKPRPSEASLCPITRLVLTSLRGIAILLAYIADCTMIRGMAILLWFYMYYITVILIHTFWLLYCQNVCPTAMPLPILVTLHHRCGDLL